jgi:hypothetical protein
MMYTGILNRGPAIYIMDPFIGMGLQDNAQLVEVFN